MSICIQSNINKARPQNLKVCIRILKYFSEIEWNFVEHDLILVAWYFVHIDATRHISGPHVESRTLKAFMSQDFSELIENFVDDLVWLPATFYVDWCD